MQEKWPGHPHPCHALDDSFRVVKFFGIGFCHGNLTLPPMTDEEREEASDDIGTNQQGTSVGILGEMKVCNNEKFQHITMKAQYPVR